MRLSVAAVAVVLASCGADEKRPEPIATPGTGAAYSSEVPNEAVSALAADFRGSCAFARPPGEAGEYTVKLRAKPSQLGAVRVRATAIFDVSSRDNLIGEIPSGTMLAGSGPLAGGSEAGGTGYAVLVRDGNGRVCRGYVSSRVVEPAN